MRICSNCETETKEILCPDCGGGSFQNIEEDSKLDSDMEILTGILLKSKYPKAQLAGNLFDLLLKIKRGESIVEN